MGNRILKVQVPARPGAHHFPAITVAGAPRSVQLQGNMPTIWFEVGPKRHGDKPVTTTVVVVGTGQEFEWDYRSFYAGTVQMPDGLVWHLYWRQEPHE